VSSVRQAVSIALLVLGAYYAWNHLSLDATVGGSADQGDAVFEKALQERAESLQVEGAGKVVRILPDDNDGSRHQRFILRLNSGQTLMVAHNIDLAPRLASLQIGDSVRFYGEYEWNSQGGVIHWTHSDPQGHHIAGWLKHDGRTYQ